MTLEFAKSEAKRRDEVLGTKHIVIRRRSDTDENGYMVVTSDRLSVLASKYDTFDY